MVQTVYCYYFTAHSTSWTLDPEAYPFNDRLPYQRFRHQTKARPLRCGLCLLVMVDTLPSAVPTPLGAWPPQASPQASLARQLFLQTS